MKMVCFEPGKHLVSKSERVHVVSYNHTSAIPDTVASDWKMATFVRLSNETVLWIKGKHEIIDAVTTAAALECNRRGSHTYEYDGDVMRCTHCWQVLGKKSR